MLWVAPQYERAQVNNAGRVRVNPNATADAREAVLSIINNWRSSHSFPLNSFQMTLRHRTHKLDGGALIAQRLKRLPAIEAKLRRFPTMKLSSMQDIGGCRAVVRTVSRAEQLALLYKQSKSKNPTGRHEFVSEDNYIATPKADGYRGIHLVYRYHSEARRHRPYNGLKIEIQLRSRLQHIWATAVETVGTFTGQALKSDVGEKKWLRFFSLMGTVMAMRENRPPVPDTHTNEKDLVAELRKLCQELRVARTLEAWRSAVTLPVTADPKAYFFLLHLDADAKRLHIAEFKLGELLKAQEAYAAVEKAAELQPDTQAVLVSVEELSLLRRAYPNYFLDTRAFLNEVRRATA
jgi:Region found in RelA / SpoT proteins